MLARPGYRRLWAARTTSSCGDAVATVALALLILELTGSALGVASLVIAEILPVLAFAPLAGILVDRLPRVRTMIAADLGRAVLAGLLPLVAGQVAAVYAVAFGLSLGTVLFTPAAAAALPDLVKDDEVIAANSGIWTAAVLAQIALAPLAGLLVAAVGPAPAFTLNAVSFLVSAAVLVRLALPPASPEPDRMRTRGWLIDATAGARMIAGDRVLRVLAVGQLLAALSAGATSALLVVLASEHLGVGATSYGLLLGAIGIGAASGPLLFLRFIRDARHPAFVFGPYALRGGVDLVLATFTAFPLALGTLVIYGLGTSTGAVTFTSLLQTYTAGAVRGRVLAAFDLLWQLGRLISLAVGSLVAETLGIRAVYYFGGTLLLLAAVIGWSGLRSASFRKP